jgi:putative aldouronate transport system permease protein
MTKRKKEGRFYLMSRVKEKKIVYRRPLSKSFNMIRRDWILYAMIALPLIYFLVFKYGSMYGIVVAFKDYNIFRSIGDSPWNNCESFKKIFAMRDFYIVVKNTIVLNFLDLIVGFPIPIMLAIMLNELKNKKYKKFSQTILYMPHFLSWIIIASLSLQIFSKNGMLNNLITKVGGSEVPFLQNNIWWIVVYVLLGVWQSAGWNTILYLAAITGINGELYEAASVDGANRLQKIFYIILPGIRKTIVTMLILNMGKMMAIGFDRPYALGNPMVSDVADVISTFVYRIGLKSQQFSIATAVGLFQSVICIIFLLLTNYVAEKLGDDGIL